MNLFAFIISFLFKLIDAGSLYVIMKKGTYPHLFEKIFFI